MSMPTGWISTVLGEHVDLLTGFPFKSAEYTDDPAGIPLLRGANVSQGRLDWSGAKRWPFERTSEFKPFFLQSGDVILAMDRPWIEAGLKYAWITSRDLPCLLVQRVARMRGTNGLLTAYLRCLIGSKAFTDYIAPIVTGVNVPHISPTQIRGFRFNLPPVQVQSRIVSVLSAYDDLIENNRLRIELLEQMAHALYREWFVRFRYPGHENVPLVASDLGPIPKGWKAGTLSDLLMLQRGFDLPKNDRREGSVPVIAATGQHGMHEHAAVKGPGVVTGRSGSLGKVLYIVEDFWPLNTTLWVKEFRRSTPELAFYVLKSLGLEQFNSGAAVPTLNRNDVSGHPVPVPPADIVRRFSDVVRDMFYLMHTIENSTVILRATRDLLLPRLISGEIDFSKLAIRVSDTAA
jgi:type I restriction enzyme S subunit